MNDAQGAVRLHAFESFPVPETQLSKFVGDCA